MDNERLGKSPIGQLVPISGQDARHGKFACFAFLPKNLPEDVPLETSTWSAIVAASESIARLEQCAKGLPEPGLLIYPSLYREALDSSALEGTHGNLPALLEARFTRVEDQTAETIEIGAFIDAAQTAFSEIRHRPLTVDLLCQTQREMFKHAPQPPQDVGAIRKHQVSIGDESVSIEERRFVPPPGDDRLRAGMDSLIAWINTTNDMPPALRAAMAHYQFETLHPFGDGNGRVGRLLIILQLMSHNAISSPIVTVSPWFYRNRARYQNELLELSVTGDWNPWVRFVCEAFIYQSDRLIKSAEHLQRWVADTQGAVNKHNWSGTIFNVITELAEWPQTTIPWISKKFSINYPGAKNIVEHLLEIGAITELTGRKYGKIYAAKEVIRILDET